MLDYLDDRMNEILGAIDTRWPEREPVTQAAYTAWCRATRPLDRLESKLLRARATVLLYWYISRDWSRIYARYCYWSLMASMYLKRAGLRIELTRLQVPPLQLASQWALWGAILWPILYFIFRLYFAH
jgi:hypothetical protein